MANIKSTASYGNYETIWLFDGLEFFQMLQIQ